jgi:hypothetical protein
MNTQITIDNVTFEVEFDYIHDEGTDFTECTVNWVGIDGIELTEIIKPEIIEQIETKIKYQLS